MVCYLGGNAHRLLARLNQVFCAWELEDGTFCALPCQLHALTVAADLARTFQIWDFVAFIVVRAEVSGVGADIGRGNSTSAFYAASTGAVLCLRRESDTARAPT